MYFYEMTNKQTLTIIKNLYPMMLGWIDIFDLCGGKREKALCLAIDCKIIQKHLRGKFIDALILNDCLKTLKHALENDYKVMWKHVRDAASYGDVETLKILLHHYKGKTHKVAIVEWKLKRSREVLDILQGGR